MNIKDKNSIIQIVLLNYRIINSEIFKNVIIKWLNVIIQHYEYKK